jgi:hypothetical protein
VPEHLVLTPKRQQPPIRASHRGLPLAPLASVYLYAASSSASTLPLSLKLAAPVWRLQEDGNERHWLMNKEFNTGVLFFRGSQGALDVIDRVRPLPPPPPPRCLSLTPPPTLPIPHTSPPAVALAAITSPQYGCRETRVRAGGSCSGFIPSPVTSEQPPKGRSWSPGLCLPVRAGSTTPSPQPCYTHAPLRHALVYSDAKVANRDFRVWLGTKLDSGTIYNRAEGFGICPSFKDHFPSRRAKSFITIRNFFIAVSAGLSRGAVEEAHRRGARPAAVHQRPGVC